MLRANSEEVHRIIDILTRVLVFLMWIPLSRSFFLAADKIMRLHAQTATIENGFVPDEAHWLADMVSELTAFPAGHHDDQVDSTA